MDQSQILQKVIENLIPLLIGVIITALGRVLGFVVSEILTGRKIAVLLVVFLGMLAINSSLAGWITLLVFLLMFGWAIFRYLYGPKEGKKIVFAGFYDSSGNNGYFDRTGLSKLTDASFFNTLSDTLAQTGLLEVRPVSVVSFKPPTLIHKFYDHDRFHKLAARYAKKSLGSIWGTVDAQGVPRDVEIILNIEHYHGRGSAQDIVNIVVDVLNLTAVRPEEKIRFIAKVLGTIWGNSFSNDLADEGEWRTALAITEKSERILIQAFTQLGAQADANGRRTIEEMKINLLPTVQIEVARNRLCGDQWDEALERLVDTLASNPIYPFRDLQEFGEFFNARYAVETTASGPYTDEAIDARVAALADRAQLHVAPHLQLLIDWLCGAGPHLQNLEEKIDHWFERLHVLFPDNPFILVYWGDALKIPTRLGLRPDLKPGPDGRLPLIVIDSAIRKYEAALNLAPNFYLISTKVAMNYWVTAHYFSKLSLDYRARMKKFDENSARARIHMTDSDQHFNQETDLDWTKFGLTNEDVDEVMKYVAEEKDAQNDE